MKFTWLNRVVIGVVAVCALSAAFPTVSADAATVRQWAGGQAGNWSDPNKWDPVGVPQNGDSLLFPSFGPATLVDDLPNLTVADITISNTERLRIDGAPGVALTISGKLDASAPASFGVPVALTPATHTIKVTNPTGGTAFNVLEFTGGVSGAGAISKTGSGTLRFSTPTSYTGTTVASAGRVELTATGTLGATSAGTTIAAGASLVVTGIPSRVVVDEPVSLSGSGSSATPYAVDVWNGKFNGQLTLAADASVHTNSGTEFAGRITGPGKLTLDANNDSVTFSHVNDYAGGSRFTAYLSRIVATADDAFGIGPAEFLSNAPLRIVDATLASPLILHDFSVQVNLEAQGASALTGPVTFLGSSGILVDEGATLALSGAMHGTPGTGPLFAGLGTIVLAGDDDSDPGLHSNVGALTFVTGSGEVLAGAVDVDAPLVLTRDGQLAASAVVNVGATGELYPGATHQRFHALTLAGYADLSAIPADAPGIDVDNFELRGTGATDFRSASVATLGHVRARTSMQITGAPELGIDASQDIPIGGQVPLFTADVGVAAPAGRFAGLPDGGRFEVEGRWFRINYAAGDGNDVVLTRVATPPPDQLPVLPAGSGYWMLGTGGEVYAFGASGNYGHATPAPGTTAVDIEPTPSGHGYWTLGSGGNVNVFGDASFHGNATLPGWATGERATALSRTPSGYGYWVFTNRGRVLAFGDADWFGDVSNVKLNGPVLDSIPTPSGEGYYMVGSDGGIFAFGDAQFFGSMGGYRLNAPVQSLVPDPDGRGYWLVASDGGVFAFDAPFRGSMGAYRLNKPVTGMVPFGNGYLMVGEDGGIFNFSDKPFFGSLGGQALASPVVAVAAP